MPEAACTKTVWTSATVGMSRPVSVLAVRSSVVSSTASPESSTTSVSSPAPMSTVSNPVIWSTFCSSFATVTVSSPAPVSMVAWPTIVSTAIVSLPAPPLTVVEPAWVVSTVKWSLPRPNPTLTTSRFEYVMPPGTRRPATTVVPPMPRPVIRLSVSTPTSSAGLLVLSTYSASTWSSSITRKFRLNGATKYRSSATGCVPVGQPVRSVTRVPETSGA